MAEHTAIEWTDSTWNPVTGCTKVGPECKHCYAERLTERSGRRFTDIRLHANGWVSPSAGGPRAGSSSTA